MKRQNYIALSLAAGLLFGTSFPAVKLGLQYISPVWFACMRVWLAFFCLFLLVRRRKIIFGFPYEYWILGLFNALAFLLQFWGMQTTSASKASFFVNSSVIFVALLSYFVYHERLGWNKQAGVFFAMVGIYLLSIGFEPFGDLFEGTLKGDLLVLGSGLSWSIFLLVGKKMVHHPEYSVLETVVLYLLTSAILMLPVSLALEGFPAQISWQGWSVLAFSSTISLALPFYFWSLGLKGLSPTVSSLLILAEILVANGIAFVFLGEKLSKLELLGAAILLTAIVLASIRSDESRIIGETS